MITMINVQEGAQERWNWAEIKIDLATGKVLHILFAREDNAVELETDLKKYNAGLWDTASQAWRAVTAEECGLTGIWEEDK